MKTIQINSEATIYDTINELSLEDKNLMLAAIDARNNAYAPYSKFSVGCALLLDIGKLVSGNNQENAAYPSGMCAERVAVWKAASQYPKIPIIKIAISAASSLKKVSKPVGPCGGCRQTLSEYEINQNKTIEIIFMGETGKIVKVPSLKSLLPFSFNSSYL